MFTLRTVALIPLAALIFALAHLGFEHLNGGVKTHHFLARTDLPGFSNWFGLLVLPVLGMAVSFRAKSLLGANLGAILPRSMLLPAVAALLYGAALAASFALRLEPVRNCLAQWFDRLTTNG
jgi:hypothetical protein